MTMTDDLLASARVYENVTPQFGTVKKLCVTFSCDGTEMTISSNACAGAEFKEEVHREEVNQKLVRFLENRPNCKVVMI